MKKSEKESLIKEIKDYIELLKDILDKLLNYKHQYRNNLITKEILANKIKKIKSIKLEQWNPEYKDKDLLLKKEKKNYLTIQNEYKLNNSKNNIIKLKYKYESKSQNISRNTSFMDFLDKVNEPLTKKCDIDIDVEKIDLSFNESFNSFSNKENISENDESDIPISKINTTTRKKNTINVYKKKTNILRNSIKISKNRTITQRNNECINILDSNRKKDRGISLKNNGNKNIVFNNKNRGVFIKKNKKNKFIINKQKLFNNGSSSLRKININPIKIIKKEENLEKININKNKQSPIANNDIDNVMAVINNNENDMNKNLFLKYNNDKCFNGKENNDIKNILYDINSKKYKESIQVIKDEIKKSNYLSINSGSLGRRGVFKKNEIKTDLKNDNCCISCT